MKFVELGCSVTHLALAWVAKHSTTSTVILGASKPEQVLDNLKALDVLPRLTPEVLAKIEDILQNRPEPAVRMSAIEIGNNVLNLKLVQLTFGRPPLDGACVA